MTNNERMFIYMLMVSAVEMMMCLIMGLVLSMLGALIMACLFFVFDIAFLVKLAFDREAAEREERAAWEREGVDLGKKEDK